MSMAQPLILVTNDDGVNAPGIKALCAALAQGRAQRLDARRVHAVVVRDQDEWLSHRQERPRPR